MELRYEVSLNFYFCTFYLRYVENENLIMMNDDLFLFLARNIGIEFVRFERKDCSNSSHSKLHCNRLIETRASIKRGPAFVTTAYPVSLEELGSLDFSTSIHFENSFKSVRFGNFFQ